MNPEGLSALSTLASTRAGVESGSWLGRVCARTWIDSLHALGVKGRPVGHAAAQAADVDVVERVGRKRPRPRAVVDFEAQVWRHGGWLDGAEVGADDFGAGEGVGKGKGPETRAVTAMVSCQ